jgi:hypothetical protein
VCSSYFVIYKLILLFVILVELLGLVHASFLFMRIILLFMFTCMNLLVKSPLGDISEKPIIWDVSEKLMMVMSYLFLQVHWLSLER